MVSSFPESFISWIASFENPSNPLVRESKVPLAPSSNLPMAVSISLAYSVAAVSAFFEAKFEVI
jgi:hypothetical protein